MTLADPVPLVGLSRRLESPYHRRRRHRRVDNVRRLVEEAIDIGGPIVLFAVSTDRQLQSASSLVNAMGSRARGFYLDRSGCLVGEAASVDYIAALPRLLRNLDDSRQLVSDLVGAGLPIAVVVAHDYGLREQALVSLANGEAGMVSILLPDGLLAQAGGADWQAPLRRRLGYRAAHRLLGTEGDPGRFGSSRPSTLLVWGPAWMAALRAPTGTTMRVAGSPRFRPSDHPRPATSGCRLLICNPTESRLQGGERLWRRFISDVTSAESEVEVRVRRRPDDPEFDGTAYSDDLGWSTHVAAVRSTVLIEAASTGRAVVALESSFWSDWMEAYIGLTDERLARFDLDGDDFGPDAVVDAAETTDPAYGPSYIADVTPEAVADILLESLASAVAEEARAQ